MEWNIRLSNENTDELPISLNQTSFNLLNMENNPSHQTLIQIISLTLSAQNKRLSALLIIVILAYKGLI